MIYEGPAGRRDAGEGPEACPRRELEEEAGYRAGRMERLATILTTPGFTDEKIHIFLARDLTPAQHNREPDEVIEVVTMPLPEAIRKIETGEVVDGKPICASLMEARAEHHPTPACGGSPPGRSIRPALYPASSSSSRRAHASGSSPASSRPAGTS